MKVSRIWARKEKRFMGNVRYNRRMMIYKTVFSRFWGLKVGVVVFSIYSLRGRISISFTIGISIVWVLEFCKRTMFFYKKYQEYSMKCIYSIGYMLKLSLTLYTFDITGLVASLFLIER